MTGLCPAAELIDLVVVAILTFIVFGDTELDHSVLSETQTPNLLEEALSIISVVEALLKQSSLMRAFVTQVIIALVAWPLGCQWATLCAAHHPRAHMSTACDDVHVPHAQYMGWHRLHTWQGPSGHPCGELEDGFAA